MKSFLSLLAVPVYICAAVAHPVADGSLAARGTDLKDYTILSHLFTQADKHDGVISEICNSISSDSTTKNNDTAIATMKSELEDLIADIEAAQMAVKAVNAASNVLRKRESEAEKLADELDTLVTAIGQTLAKVINMGYPLQEALGDLVDRTLGALTSLGGPLAEAIPDATDEISAILTKILGSL